MKKKEEWQRLGHILYYQAVSDMKQEIDRKYLGVVWWFLDPMLYMGVFYVLFSSGLRGGSSGPEFVWFLLCGLVPWKWFAGSLENCSRSITSNASLISQVYFPKIILPATAFVAQSFKFMIVLLVLLLVLRLRGHFLRRIDDAAHVPADKVGPRHGVLHEISSPLTALGLVFCVWTVRIGHRFGGNGESGVAIEKGLVKTI